MNFSFKPAKPLILVFLTLTAVIIAAILLLATQKIDYTVLMGANCLFFLISLFIFKIQYRAMIDKNPNLFIRRVMGSMMIKLFSCIIAVVAYYFLSGPSFNKPAVYLSMLIYIIYLVVEVGTIMKLNKTKHA